MIEREIKLKFDPEVHIMGGLCARGHDYNGSGMSVRYGKSRKCVICNRIYINKYKIEHEAQTKAIQAQYYLENKEEIKQRVKDRRKKDPGKDKEYRKGWRENNRDRIKGYYIKSLTKPAKPAEKPVVKKTALITSVAQDIAALKQEAVWFNNLLQEIRNEQAMEREMETA